MFCFARPWTKTENFKIIKVIADYFKEPGLDWKTCVSISTDGAMNGRLSLD